MISREKRKKHSIWVVVEVASGIPVAVEAYSDLNAAKARESQLRKNINPENDEVGIFEVTI